MKIVDLRLKPEEAFNHEVFSKIVNKKVKSGEAFKIIRRSIDARKSTIWVNVRLEIDQDFSPPSLRNQVQRFIPISNDRRIVIVGAGPAGLFAAMRLIELGIKPIVIERGKDVRSRRRDIAAINKDHIVHQDSNYCFGEGGAGTYSDGKLYTRSKKRGDLNRVLEILVAHGAREEILYDAHPHIGTNKLPKIVEDIRLSIINAGGEVRFENRVTDFIVEKGSITGVIGSNGEKITADGVILATGHSARDIFELLNRKKIIVEPKPFALGVRIEHPQELIDQIQYHCKGARSEYLPAATYSLVNQAYQGGVQRGVFSFCMCPGGFVVPAATSPGEVVVNGMSPSRRDSKFANSGIVVAIDNNDLLSYTQYGPLAGMYFQAAVEQLACNLGNQDQTAPAQRMMDFINKTGSSSLNDTSYQPGLKSINMNELLPAFIEKSLRKSFVRFGKNMRGYLTNEAQLIGVESRTSSPVRIPRNNETLEHIQVKKLFPCGEGAGYAGGIVSAAMDGERCAEAVSRLYFEKEMKVE